MTVNVEHAALSDRGRVRDENQDNWSASPDDGLYVVSDGLGGHFAGALASQIVVEVLPTMVRSHTADVHDLGGRRATGAVRCALKELSQQVHEQTRGEPGLEGMGATVVLLLMRGERALVGHMGDSRAYRLRGTRLKQLTRDHSIVQVLLDRDEISPEEAACHPSRGRVTQSVGMAGTPRPEVRTFDIREGDRFLLCTDGLTQAVSDEALRRGLIESPSVEVACQRLVDSANAAGGVDNITAMVLSVGRVGERQT
jgi:protein phosphatase